MSSELSIGDRVSCDYFGRVRTGEIVDLDGTVGIRCDDDDQVRYVDESIVHLTDREEQ